MNHQFTPLQSNPEQCNICSRVEKAHGNCECCGHFDYLVTFMTMKMCSECYEKEKELQIKNTSQEAQSNRVERANEVLTRAKEIDAQVTIRTDLFSAATIAIADIKAAIDADETIENKPYILAETLKERFNHFKTVVFEANEKIIEAGNHQKAIQTYLNTLANQLRAEEREKLKLQDMNYKPNPVKAIKDLKPTVTKPRGFMKTEVKKYALELSRELGKPVSEFMLQSICVSKGITPEKAADVLRRIIKEGASM